MIGWDPSSKKRVNYLSFIEGKGGGKDILCSAQNAALFVDLLKNIFSVINYENDIFGMKHSSAGIMLILK